jgi:hypothetical protein
MLPAAGAFAACLGFNASDLQSLAKGAVLVRTQPTADSRDVAVAGAIRIGISPSAFRDRFRDITNFKKSEVVLQIGRFSDPPQPSDLEPLTFGDDDVKALRHCRPGDCAIKLDVKDIEASRNAIDWKSPRAADQARTFLRNAVLRYAKEYLAGGDQALGAYDDKHQPVPLAGAFRALVGASRCLPNVFPDFARWLMDFPRVDRTGFESFLYWSKEDYSMKPVVSITHVVMYQAAPEGPLLIATKGIYSTHYIDASLGLTALVDANDGGRPAVDVLYLNRSRVDTFGGPFGGVARAIVLRRQRAGAAKELARLRTRLQAENSAR